MSDVRGKFLWYELMTTDPDAAVDFYGSVVGWGTEAWEGGPTPYRMWTAGETPVGGLMELPEEARAQGAPPHWLPYIGTPDVDATISQAEELGGGVIVPAMDLPEVGRMAILGDPQGAVFAIYTPASAPPEVAEGPPQPGCMSWHELGTSDWEAAWDFYHALFGWEKADAMDMGEGNMYQMYSRPGGPPLGGIYTLPPEIPAPPHWLCYAMVDDVNPVAERVKELGGKVLNGPMEVPGGDLIAMCMDPQGAAFAVHSLSGNGAGAG